MMHSGTWNLLTNLLHVPVLDLDLDLTSVCGASLCSPWFHLGLLQILRFPPTDHRYACAPVYRLTGDLPVGVNV